MAEFSRLIITKKGHALVAKTLAGGGAVDIKFTRVLTTDESFTGQPVEQLEDVAELAPVKQSGGITSLERINEAAVKVETYFSNTELTEGYYMRTLGLYAEDPDEGEILYAVTTEVTGQCWMPAYNSVSVSGAYIQLVTTVGNADHVTIEVNPSATATIGDIKKLQEQMDKKQDVVVIFEEAAVRENIESGEGIPTLMGKIRKFFTDLKTVAFSGRYDDLADRPGIANNCTTTAAGMVLDARQGKFLQDQISQVSTNFQAGCEKIAAAVTSMGVTTAANAAVSVIVTNIKKIVTKLTGTATPSQVITGATFYSVDAKTKQMGTMAEQGAWSATISPGDTIAIPAGHHNGNGSVTAMGGIQHKYLEAWGQGTNSHVRTTDILDNTAGIIATLKLMVLTLDNKKYNPEDGTGSQTPLGTLTIKDDTSDTVLFTQELSNNASYGDSASSVVTVDLGNQLVDVSRYTSIRVELDLKIGYNIGILSLDYYTQQ